MRPLHSQVLVRDFSPQLVRWLAFAFCAVGFALLPFLAWSEGDNKNERDGRGKGGSSETPAMLTAEHFADLKSNSPFLRSLDLSKTLVLTGVAQVNGELVATIFDRESKETRLVSRTANKQNWQLVGVDGDRQRLDRMTAQISVAGGEVVSVQFDPAQLQVKVRASVPQIPADQAAYITEQARNYRHGFRGDGVRGPPSPQMIEKLSKLTLEQRSQVIYQARQMDDNLSNEDRQKAIFRLADEAMRRGR